MSAAVHATHKRLFDLILRHGADAEKRQTAQALEEMRDFRLAFPGSQWEPMETVQLPLFLVSRCRRIAMERQARARRFSLENRHGVTRSLDDEIRSVEAQHAACLMLGLEFAAATTHTQAKANGNLGSNVSAFCPKPGRYGLLIDADEKPTRMCHLLYEDGDHRYTHQGWVRAGAVMLEEYRQTYVRRGVASHPYRVPVEQLSTLRSWFE